MHCLFCAYVETSMISNYLQGKGITLLKYAECKYKGQWERVGRQNIKKCTAGIKISWKEWTCLQAHFCSYLEITPWIERGSLGDSLQ